MLAAFVLSAILAAPRHEVSITFDDLPDVGENPIEVQESLTRRLLDELKTGNVPTIGFVNEDKLLDDDGQPDPRRVALIQQWLDAGAQIGNHTFSHIDLNRVPLEQFEQDVLRGEAITGSQWGAGTLAGDSSSAGGGARDPLKWFRHPYLDTGETLAKRAEADAFLAGHGYRVAPVTIDSSEWIYDQAYDCAAWWQRPALRRSYIRYMRRRFEWAEAMSHLVFHRDIAQILLLHASTLNADAFPDLAAMMRARGYRFISIDDAFRDAAYQTPDRWTGGGVSWLERWGVARGIAPGRFEHDPSVPPWVQRLAGARDE
jgi:peptidoglycan/xylan/chitin deacetylase (PgdA/CDA1 family)